MNEIQALELGQLKGFISRVLDTILQIFLEIPNENSSLFLSVKIFVDYKFSMIDAIQSSLKSNFVGIDVYAQHKKNGEKIVLLRKLFTIRQKNNESCDDMTIQNQILWYKLKSVAALLINLPIFRIFKLNSSNNSEFIRSSYTLGYKIYFDESKLFELPKSYAQHNELVTDFEIKTSCFQLQMNISSINQLHILFEKAQNIPQTRARFFSEGIIQIDESNNNQKCISSEILEQFKQPLSPNMSVAKVAKGYAPFTLQKYHSKKKSGDDNIFVQKKNLQLSIIPTNQETKQQKRKFSLNIESELIIQPPEYKKKPSLPITADTNEIDLDSSNSFEIFSNDNDDYFSAEDKDPEEDKFELQLSNGVMNSDDIEEEAGFISARMHTQEQVVGHRKMSHEEEVHSLIQMFELYREQNLDAIKMKASDKINRSSLCDVNAKNSQNGLLCGVVHISNNSINFITE